MICKNCIHMWSFTEYPQTKFQDVIPELSEILSVNSLIFKNFLLDYYQEQLWFDQTYCYHYSCSNMLELYPVTSCDVICYQWRKREIYIVRASMVLTKGLLHHPLPLSISYWDFIVKQHTFCRIHYFIISCSYSLSNLL